MNYAAERTFHLGRTAGCDLSALFGITGSELTPPIGGDFEEL
jgi:hypothetical protein